jgi:hypothetical protein
MNEQTIEKLLQKAPRVKIPARLLEELQSNIELPRATTANHESRIVNGISFRRWLPACGFALWFLGCIVVFGIQASRIAELNRVNNSLRTSLTGIQPSPADADRAETLAKELEQLHKDAADVQRLRGEAEQLRAQVRELATLREQNQQLRAELKSKSAPMPKPEEDFFAPAANPANRTRCVNNLKQVGLAARIWANDHGDVLPRDFETMKNELVTDKTTFCPADQSTRYEIISPGASELQPQVVYSRCPIHNIVGLCDGSVQQLSPPLTVVQKHGQWVIGRTGE